jgi:hypothetical protein
MQVQFLIVLLAVEHNFNRRSQCMALLDTRKHYNARNQLHTRSNDIRGKTHPSNSSQIMTPNPQRQMMDRIRTLRPQKRRALLWCPGWRVRTQRTEVHLLGWQQVSTKPEGYDFHRILLTVYDGNIDITFADGTVGSSESIYH